MSLPGAAAVLASGVQGGGAKPAPAQLGDLESAVALLAALVVAAALIVVLARRRRRRARAVSDQWGALAVMGELCPHGWEAQITLYGWGAPVPSDAPPARTPLIELEWKQYDEEPGHVAVARRAWAASIPEALQTMVDDRCTDLTLEQIERAAGGEELWEP